MRGASAVVAIVLLVVLVAHARREADRWGREAARPPVASDFAADDAAEDPTAFAIEDAALADAAAVP